MNEFDFDRDDFERWLREQPPTAEVGIPDHECVCPIAQWLRSRGYHPLVRAEGITVGWQEYRTPQWIADYIGWVDLEPPVPMQARRALEILDSIRTPSPPQTRAPGAGGDPS